MSEREGPEAGGRARGSQALGGGQVGHRPAGPGHGDEAEHAAGRGDHGPGHGAHGHGAGHNAHHDHGAGHGDHAGHDPAIFRDRFWISLLFTLPTLVWSEQVQALLGYRAPAFPGSHLIPAIFGTAVLAVGGVVFLRGAADELRARQPGMMTLVALAISVAFAFSLAVELGFAGMALWWELASLVTIMLLGHWIEMRSIGQARGAVAALARLLPGTATRLVGDREEEVPLDELRAGDVVLIRPGERIPADGAILQGASALDESMITGESRPIDKGPGDRVIAGTVNGAGSLRVEVRGVGEDTALAGIVRLVEQAQSSRSRAQDLADRAAFYLTFVALGAGAITLVVWLAAGASGAFAVERVVTVLVIACPHALGLAIPLVVAISTTLAARAGLLVRERRGLERARDLDAIVFDKTGTLTRGAFRVVAIAADPDLGEEEALRIAAAIERDSEHSIARGIVQSAEERGLEPKRATAFEALPGHGVRAEVDGATWWAGGPKLLARLEAEVPAALRRAEEEAAAQGRAAIHLVEGGSSRAVLAITDAVRPESREAVRTLHDQGIEVAMLTGDARAVAEAVAAELGIDRVWAEVLPEEKVRKVEALRREGKRVAMVGDGVNDAPALLTADVGIAIGAGTDVAVEAGDVVLVRSDPRDVPRIVELSRATWRKMVQNLWWAAGYNVVALPLAAGALAGQGIVLHPAVGAVLMSASTVIVALNAQLLRRKTL